MFFSEKNCYVSHDFCYVSPKTGIYTCRMVQEFYLCFARTLCMETVGDAIQRLSEAISNHLVEGGELDEKLKELMIIINRFPQWKSQDDLLNEKEIELIGIVNQILISDLSSYFTLSFLAKTTGISMLRIKTVYRKAFNKSLPEYQHDLRLKKAAQLLLSTEFSVKEVSYAVGYKNVSNFSESFKKYFGYSPSTLKKNNQSA
jgi:YesN/AraC family two-component response regulator